ncbi:S8 family serine peptidase [Arthrobacter sp. NIO-1057]|uniref:S8 family serine peptidase n=1 Tax=Arthrobacter sp. NIO-1057 TaxID=993071 RepID=UPI00071D811C|nr:S8 family serine peptidase [Arthrobacter sp. NIO-1057]KSU64186.1 peptidase S8 [Arthrobacter sp. NIO-1057]SCC51944.1 Subtilase family protein [Arthrobacter sp. NIO-1057]
MFSTHAPRTAATEVPDRFVLIFDAPDASTPGIAAAAREEEVPRLLGEQGYSISEYFPTLGIAVVTSKADQLEDFQARCAGHRLPPAVVPELIYRILPESTAPKDSYADTAQFTWGLQAVGADVSTLTGKGINVAVLDTGFDAAHPDFAGRTVTTKSFIQGEDASDGHGHGTHCIGTSCGPRTPKTGPGYGVASEANIFAGKVLGADGSGSDSTILAGINWALENKCEIISMSLGADVKTVHPPYVTAGRRSLELGSLIIAAAGNNAQRSAGNPGFVGAPANSPYIMAVAALDSQLAVADFSAQALGTEGGEVDIAGPGVNIYSSWPEAKGYNTISGTSMATPHVAGVAALLAQSSGLRAQELWDRLVADARDVSLPAKDAGAGLTQAPSTPES